MLGKKFYLLLALDKFDFSREEKMMDEWSVHSAHNLLLLSSRFKHNPFLVEHNPHAKRASFRRV
jgi:hypothetical protein